MASRCQEIHLSVGKQRIKRVVRWQADRTELGIQTGYVECEGRRIPVWRPGNPFGVGLDHSWRDGIWRNMFEVSLPLADWEESGLYAADEYRIGRQKVTLPAAEFDLSHPLKRYLRQHLG